MHYLSHFFYLRIVKRGGINFLALFDWKLSIQHARLRYNYAPLPNAHQPTFHFSQQFSVQFAPAPIFNYSPSQQKKIRTRVQFLWSDAAKNENTAQAPACYYLVSNIHSGSGGGAAPAADETDVQRVHEGGGTQYRFSSSDSPGKCVCFRKHTRTCLSLRLHLVFCLSLSLSFTPYAAKYVHKLMRMTSKIISLMRCLAIVCLLWGNTCVPSKSWIRMKVTLFITTSCGI
jgi:hypothetical protein